MPADRIAEWYTSVSLLVIGVSHITSPRPWALFFKDLLARPYGGLAIGLLHLIPWLAVLLIHNVWTPGPFLIVTIIAWGSTIKGTLYLLWPALPSRVAARQLEHPERFRIAGAVA